ncbi:uncharacterized protein B0J16DRAFT_85289 [Fusarium flagelliforme]|uniref:uncharacterized protein n=1 Tax=Fusarium flagelliforme TaxID=2675880 RepID=UPI001E8CAB0A|nr:uncharacterized protein B0J16DRAFT_85289 [Fusarium flagelliforme]KAH7193772.1 hypothetical protein B0J16DRAFT_85289 [Fusarium flagelliforme]
MQSGAGLRNRMSYPLDSLFQSEDLQKASKLGNPLFYRPFRFAPAPSCAVTIQTHSAESTLILILPQIEAGLVQMIKTGSTTREMTDRIRGKDMSLTSQHTKMPPITKARLRQTIDVLKAIHNITDPRPEIAQRKKSLTTVDHLIDKGDISEYIKAQSASDSALQYAALHPNELTELDELNRNAFALEMVMNSIQPEFGFDLEL